MPGPCGWAVPDLWAWMGPSWLVSTEWECVPQVSYEKSAVAPPCTGPRLGASRNRGTWQVHHRWQVKGIHGAACHSYPQGQQESQVCLRPSHQLIVPTASSQHAALPAPSGTASTRCCPRHTPSAGAGGPPTSPLPLHPVLAGMYPSPPSRHRLSGSLTRPLPAPLGNPLRGACRPPSAV